MNLHSFQQQSSSLLAQSTKKQCTFSKRAHQNNQITQTTSRFQNIKVQASDVAKELFGGDLSGPKTSPSGKPKAAPKPKDLDEIELKSELGLDYTKLKDLLKEQQFQKADDETRSLLIQQAGDEAVKRGWVYFSEVQYIPAADLQTVDKLWVAASASKFGFSVQKRIWRQLKEQWVKFFKAIDWTFGEQNNYRKWPGEFVYSLEAVKGHLPLTNCLRGTRLIQAIFEHPAFDEAKK